MKDSAVVGFISSFLELYLTTITFLLQKFALFYFMIHQWNALHLGP